MFRSLDVATSSCGGSEPGARDESPGTRSIVASGRRSSTVTRRPSGEGVAEGAGQGHGALIPEAQCSGSLALSM